MKSIRSFPIGMVITGSLAASLHFLHAQETAIPIQAAGDTPDSIVQLTADSLGLPLISPEALPASGTFFLMVPGPNGIMALPYPCPPGGPALPTYSIIGGVFLVDGTGGQVTLNNRLAANSTVNSALAAQAAGVVNLVDQVQGSAVLARAPMRMAGGMMMAADDSSGPGGITNTDVVLFSFTPDFGTNLYIAQPNVASNYFTGIISNSFADIQYEIQYTTDLTQPWQSAGWFVYGSELTNWTPFSVPSISPTNLFLRVRSWQDDGSGLPIWWQEQYFGTTGVDPYGDPMGDGWNNLQKFQNGMNPNVFYTPPAPQGLTVNYNSVSNTAVISWLPSPGPVTGYTVTNSDGVTFNFSAGTNDFADNLSADVPNGSMLGDPTIYKTYQVQAHYAGGDSAWSAPVSLDIAQGISATIVATQTNVNLVVYGLPTDTVAIRLTKVNQLAMDFGDTSYNTNEDIPIGGFINGMYSLPAFWAPVVNAYGSGEDIWFVQTISTSGDVSAAVFAENDVRFWGENPTATRDAPYLSWPAPFFDGRSQLKQNLIFQLRAATVDFPFEFYQFGEETANPITYVYAGFIGDPFEDDEFNEYKPVNDNYLYRNFVFNSSELDASGRTTTGVGGSYGSSPNTLSLPDTPAYQFQPPSTFSTTLATLLSTNASQWLCSYAFDSPTNYLGEIGISTDGSGHYSMASNASNYWGLAFVSAKIANSAGTTVLSAGGNTTQSGYFYPDTAQPQFQTAEYDFWIPQLDKLPGQSGFSVTNTSRLMITSVGNSMISGNGGSGVFNVAAYAKLSVQNAYSGVYGYLQQYFDTAYKITNGVVTTNTTGILSPYGDFFATEPGPAALVTMTDIDTDLRGTGVVYCASMAVDKNADGIMDLSFSGLDATSVASPMRAWVNNGLIVPGTGGNLDHDVQPGINGPFNYTSGQISCQRDLENFFRLWICGVPSLPASQGYSVTLSCSGISGSPAINLYFAETNGGTLYLTDTNAAQSLAGQTMIGTISTNNGLIFPASFFDGSNKYFLFEGAGIGEGQFTLTIYQGTNVIAQTSTYIDLHDIKDLYEQAHITNVTNTWPEMVQQTETSGYQVDHYLANNSSQANQLAVFVHGWRMTQFDYEDFSDAMFKRLYWQGYQGRFASLRWPTRSRDTDTNSFDLFGTQIPADTLTYNRSEHIAFESGTGAAAYFNNLRQRFTNDTISVAAHSQGNIVMMEALKELAAANQAPLDNYVMMQAAVPAHCYDTTVPNYYNFTNEESIVPTPNTYSNYAAGIDNALRVGGKIANFFNTNDYALVSASTNVPVFGFSMHINTSWIMNEQLAKPVPFGYSYNPVNSTAYLTNVYEGVAGRTVTDPLELMPFVARPRSLAVGSQPGVGGMVNGGQLDLFPLGFTGNSFDHSGQFNRNIQDPVVQSFYPQLRSKLFP